PDCSVLDLGRVPLGHDRHPDSSGSGIKAVTLHSENFMLRPGAPSAARRDVPWDVVMAAATD
ncbi:hypothetical protein, partial [Kineococcus rhizosphaerae]|uniref:hypothetical protein n=1 Tax=Kineococcus rhizosphaerae TaxID=559628 RepID=UPI001B80B1ED